MREKKIYCGKHYREVDIYPYTAAQLTASTRGKRSKKIKETEPKQKNLNDKNARRYFTQTANLNFGSDPEALHVTATYSGKYLPDTVEQAEQEATNFLRRVQYRRKKEGLPPLKYMIVTAYTTKRNSETPVRIHHHIIMNGGLDRDVVEDLWRKRRRKGHKKGDKIGFCNADRLCQLIHGGFLHPQRDSAMPRFLQQRLAELLSFVIGKSQGRTLLEI